MLSDLLLNIVYSVTSGFLNLLPSVSFETGLANAIQNINGYISGLDFILPTTAIFSILGLFLTLEGILLSINVINWFIRKIPTVN